MYLYDTLKDTAAVEFCEKVLKMDPADWDLDAVNRIEVLATNFSDDGEDYCEYRVYDCQDNLMAARRDLGY